MPPKPKFTREEIIEAALKIAADRGLKALTSRELGATLGSSARPIFTVFNNMDEVHSEVHKAAMAKFDGYARKISADYPPFKQIGMQTILFAKEQPKLFRLLFMSENSAAMSFDDLFATLGATAVLCIEILQSEYELAYNDAMQLFRSVWIFTYGMGSLIASGTCSFTDDDIQNMLSRQFSAMLMLTKSGKAV